MSLCKLALRHHGEFTVDFGLENFKKSPLGRRVGAVLQDPEMIRDMVTFTRHEEPAVRAVGRPLLALGRDVTDDQVKKTIGRWVKEILARRGFVPWKTGRVPPGNLFSTGMIYRSQ
jgi:hypothetical protein